MKKLLGLLLLLLPFIASAQPWSADGICDHTDGVQWNSGGAKGCACTWYTVSGTDTILNCAFGDCGQNALYECVYDCNGHNGYTTQSVPRTCDATASPICWFNGAGSAGELFCSGLTLPIELYEFWGSEVNEYNELYWSTASENGNSHFIVSYSSGEDNFIDIGTIKGAGTTIIPQKYRFIHGNPKMGVSYYKLRQVDYNGTSEEFYTIAINNNGVKGNELFSNIYPNPSADLFYFNYNGHVKTPILVEIVDFSGKVIHSGIVNEFNNSQAISFNSTGISKGVYLVNISQGDNIEIKKIAVL